MRVSVEARNWIDLGILPSLGVEASSNQNVDQVVRQPFRYRVLELVVFLPSPLRSSYVQHIARD